MAILSNCERSDELVAGVARKACDATAHISCAQVVGILGNRVISPRSEAILSKKNESRRRIRKLFDGPQWHLLEVSHLRRYERLRLIGGGSLLFIASI